MSTSFKIGFILATNPVDVHWVKPLAFGYLKAYLDEKLGIPVTMDLLTSIENVASYDVIGVSSTSQDYWRAIEIARSVKAQSKDIITVLGGHHITYLPSTMDLNFDFGVIGEGEETFLELVRYLHSHSRNIQQDELQKIAGLAYHNKDIVKITAPRQLINSLDSIPHPFRGCDDTPYLFTSRGCPYKCSFCASSAFWDATRFFSAEYVVEEIEQILNHFPNVRDIPIWDDLVIVNLPRFKKIVDLLEQKGLVTNRLWSFSVRANLVNDELCETLKRLGNITVSFGAESASDRILKLMRKNTTVAQNQKALDILKAQGIPASCSFIIGWPGETEEEVRATFDFILSNARQGKIAADSPISTLMPMPGTEVWDQAVDRGIIDIQNFDWKRLSIFASYRQSNVAGFTKWVDLRRANGSLYLNESAVPQERLYQLMDEHERNVQALLSQPPLPDRQPDSLAAKGVISPLQLSSGRGATYYTNVRPEMLNQINGSPERVLEIGCAAGALGKAVKQRYPSCEFIGVELVAEVAEEAKKHLDKVIVGNAEKFELSDFGCPEQSVDYIILGDVLEHLYDPWTLLHRVRRLLKPDGKIVASIPNVRHLSVINSLLQGRFRYESEGILDATHLRFFTLAEIQEMMSATGYFLIGVQRIQDLSFPDLKFPINLDMEKFTLKNVTAEEAEDLKTRQYLITAKSCQSIASFPMSDSADHSYLPRYSIIIPTYNSVDYTQRCLETLYQNTPLDALFEVIVVDNASIDGTLPFLESASQRYAHLRVLHNSINLGFAKACNQGARVARGEMLVFLNNDIEPHKGWLQGMVDVLKIDKNVGVVGSRLLYPNGSIQHVGMVVNNQGQLIHLLRDASPKDFTAYLSEPREYQFVTAACMLIPADLFSAVGGFDEAYVNGYEDVDLCMRVRDRGYRVMYAPNSELMHAESKSAGRYDRETANRQRFLNKWQSKIQRDERSYLKLLSRPEFSSIQWSAPVFDFSGYARLARQAILNLHAKGMNQGVQHLGLEERFIEDLKKNPSLLSMWAHLDGQHLTNGIHIAFRPPVLWDGTDMFAYHRSQNPGFNTYVGITMFETDRLPVGWADACNGLDEVWVPCTFNKDTFTKAGVDPNKLHVVPFGLDIRAYNPKSVHPMPINGRKGFVFLSTFQWNKRKGWDILLKAYLTAFTVADDVCLVLRTYPDAIKTPPIRERIDTYIAQLGFDKNNIPPIILIDDFIPDEQMPALYAAADAYVLPTRGEGWGIPFMEAMAMGLPVIATRWSGHLDFMNDDNSYLIDINGLEPISPDQTAENLFYTNDQYWAAPSVEHTTALMRHIYEHRDEAKAKGARARAYIRDNWPVTCTADWIGNRLEQIQASQKSASEGESVVSAPIDKSLPTTVVWEGSQFVHHSLALINREMAIRFARDKHIELSVLPVGINEFGAKADPRFKQISRRMNQKLSHSAEFHVRHQWPPVLTAPKDGHWIVMQPWEFGSIPKDWIAAWRDQADELWVYTNYVRDCYVQSGMPADRIQVIPCGVDVSKVHPKAPKLKLKTKKKYKFLFVGGTIGRKGIDVLLNAYVKTFTNADDVCLIIKDMGGKAFYKGQTSNDLIDKCKALPNAPEIEYVDRMLNDQELAGLYTACDCLVHPYRGEGFGLPIAEAMASGLPVIVTGHGAAVDFCNEENAYLIPATVFTKADKYVDSMETVDHPWWYEPDAAVLQQHMRHVFEHRDEAKAKGKVGCEHIRANFTWDIMAKRMQERFDALRDTPIRRFAPKQVVITPPAPILQPIAVAVSEIVAPENDQAIQDLLEQAGRLEEQNEAEMALRLYQEALTLSPSCLEAVLNLGRLELTVGDLANAVAYLREAVLLDPEHILARSYLGIALQSSGDLSGAIEQLEIALIASDASAPLMRTLADAYLAARKHEDAIALYKRLTETPEGQASDVVGMAEAFKGLGQLSFAQECYELALEVDPASEAAATGLQLLRQAS